MPNSKVVDEEVKVDEEVVDEEVEVEVEETEEGEERKERKQYNVSPEKFVTTWQSSNSAAEVAEKLGMPKNIVLARSAVYRKPRKDGTPGIPLKKMPRTNPRRLDIESLSVLAKTHGPKQVQAEVEAPATEG